MWRFYDSSGRQKFNTSPVISLVTSLPSSPQDGDEIILTDSLTAGTYQWHLRYVAARASNKWVFIGGSLLAAEVATQETCSSTAFSALATPGPTITIPVAGDYTVTIEAGMTAAGARRGFFSYSTAGSTATIGADECDGSVSVASEFNIHNRTKTKTGLAASATLTMLYSESGGSLDYYKRRISALPIAIGG